ncbi:histidine phosphatase family protein [Sulfurimonas sp. HSL-3221]|uniref:SixA phosphatase family protein n=1 Tax=Thiomicrolovo sulfuroxydans TaxID=2894755 RepID=UPI001E418F4C|nr:histidine phosphatase family protein [Sulfurimonas sp. HSL-3221]UFS61743.1 histidine phosphatase family protein [Sulfurimonas sp. HSL-3221]
MIHHAKSDWEEPGASDFERGLTDRGYRDINTIGSYLLLRGIVPDIILSSSALRAQESADKLAAKVGFDGPLLYLSELYLTPPETILETVMLQEDDAETIFVIGHNPQLTGFANMLTDEHVSKIPTMGMVAMTFDIGSWQELEEKKGAIDFFIFPKQFKYYLPKQIRAVLDRNGPGVQ